MPNVNITVYLSDTDYARYIKRKSAIRQKLKLVIKQAIGGNENENKKRTPEKTIP